MSDELVRRAAAYRWLIFCIVAVGYALVYFHRLCPAVLAVDMMRDLRADATLTGILASAYFYPYALMQLPAALLSDSWGPRKTITLFFSVAVVGSVVLGIAPSTGWAILGRGLVGLGVAMLFIPTLKILAEWFEVRRFALMTGILMAVGGLGLLTGQAPLAWLSTWIGWRRSFVAVGGVTAVVTVFVWWFVRDRPADLKWPSPAEHTRAAAPSIALWEGVRRVFSYPAFWPLAVWFFFNCAVVFSFGGVWGGPYMNHVYGLGKMEYGKILSMIAVGMLVGSPLLSFCSDHLFKGRKSVLIFGSACVVVLTGILAFATDRIPHAGLYLVCLGLGVFSGAIVVIAFTSTKELFPVQMAGTATGLVNLFPFAGGAVLQTVLGAILDCHGTVGDDFVLSGYRQGFLVLFGCAAVAFLASLCLKETMQR